MLEADPELAVAYGIFSVRQARAAGYSRADIERLARRGGWRRCGHGVLAVVSRVHQPGDELVLAALRAGPGAVVGFASAAHLLGWDFFSAPPKPQLIVGETASRAGAYRIALASDEVELVGILRVTTPKRTALDLAADLALETAVIALDSGLRTRRVTHEQLTRYFETSHRAGVRGARAALALADPKSGSVAESEARLLFARAGLPTPQTQFVVRSGHRFIARADFAWEEARLAVEIDGFMYHSAGDDFQRDRTKQNAVQLDGWLVLRFTVADIRRNPDKVIAEIRRALARPLPD